MLGRIATAVALVILAFPGRTDSWGRWGHHRITEQAIASLPDTLRQFFEVHAKELVAKSVEPDEARRWDEDEQYRHYLDIDAYGTPPFTELPREFDAAVKKFGPAGIDTTGTLPWTIERFTKILTGAFKTGDRDSIVHTAGYLAHYVSDAHVPLHTVVNYDGQLTGQRGVHARWESHIPERFGEGFDIRPGEARLLSSPRDEAFKIVLTSFSKADSVLAADIRAQQTAEGGIVTADPSRDRRRQLSDPYYTEFHRQLSGMVERQLQCAVSAVASYWYTAWVNAGRPEFPASDKPKE